MTFLPGVAIATDRARPFVLSGQALAVVRTEAGVVLPPLVSMPAHAIPLGELDGEPCFAIEAPAPEGSELVPLRALFGAVPDPVWAAALRALALVAWDRDHRFCGRCGAATAPSTSERARVCSACALAHYPRISPAVIVRVERDDTILLARNARNPLRFHSVLAGFVEVGESLEDTVRREIREEAGIEVADLRYFGSQGWPFSSSLMIGFTARWAGGDLVPDPSEILDAGWFTADALPTVPPPLSIARALIDDFVARY